MEKENIILKRNGEKVNAEISINSRTIMESKIILSKENDEVIADINVNNSDDLIELLITLFSGLIECNANDAILTGILLKRALYTTLKEYGLEIKRD